MSAAHHTCWRHSAEARSRPTFAGSASLTSGARKTGAEATLVTAVHDESNYIVANGSGNYATATQAATLDGGINWLPTVVARANRRPPWRRLVAIRVAWISGSSSRKD